MKTLFMISVLTVLIVLACNQEERLTAVPDYGAIQYKKDSVALRDVFKNKVSVVNLWFTTCTPCLKEIPFLTQVYNKYGHQQDFAFYSVAANTAGELDQFLDPQEDSLNVYRRAFINYNLPNITYPILIGTKIDRQITKTSSGGISIDHSDRESMDEITRHFKSNVYPTTIIFDKDGKEVFRESGFPLNKAEMHKQKLVCTIDSCLNL